MKTVLTYGTFDAFHYGHLNLLKRAKSLGDFLIVGLSTDEFNEIKGKKSLFNFKEREDMLKGISYIDCIISERNWEQKIEDIKKYRIDTFVIGDDWFGKFDYLKKYCKVVYLKRTPNISSTLIKNNIK